MAAKVIVFANSDYLDVLNNWLAAVQRLRIDGVTVIAIDEPLHAHLQARGIPTILRLCSPHLESLWIHRVAVIRELLAAGHDVIHSDADAVWLRNPLPYLDELDHDMLFSQGTIWPPDVLGHFGFVVCCGFFALRNTDQTRAFVDRLSTRVRLDKDDQISCNRLLMEGGVRWTAPAAPYRIPFRGHEFVCDTAVRHGSDGVIRLALLPHAAFQRIYENHDEVYVRHLISDKHQEDKRNVLARHGLLFP